MKILFWQWNAFMQKGMENALKKLKIEYDVLYRIPKDWEEDRDLESDVDKALATKVYDKVLSVNYCPVVSAACERYGIKYVSWVYDSPIHIKNINSFSNSCNEIYFFDRGQVAYYESLGYRNVHHLPLAADETVWKEALNCSRSVREHYSCDVAFVGQLYQSDYEYLMRPLPLYERGELEGIVSMQGQLYGAYILDQMLNEDRMKRLNQHYQAASAGKVEVKKSELEYACACEVTSRERKMALALLESRCNLHHHSGNKDEKDYGYVDYYKQMPAVFSNAKINLNISLKTIRTGIPLRILDILSCGGFLITNYQEELLEYFEPGVDLVLYDDVKDLVRQVTYYLNHDEERNAIAQNGRRKVLELFSFDERMKVLLNL